MKIIKKGNPEKIRREIEFECPNCGCVFIAEGKEYTTFETALGVMNETKCPECSLEVNKFVDGINF